MRNTGSAGRQERRRPPGDDREVVGASPRRAGGLAGAARCRRDGAGIGSRKWSQPSTRRPPAAAPPCGCTPAASAKPAVSANIVTRDLELGDFHKGALGAAAGPHKARGKLRPQQRRQSQAFDAPHRSLPASPALQVTSTCCLSSPRWETTMRPPSRVSRQEGRQGGVTRAHVQRVRPGRARQSHRRGSLCLQPASRR